MRALAAGGDPEGALAAFGAFGDRLGRQAGLDTSPEALELRERIMHRQPPAPAPGRPRVPAVRPVEPVPFTRCEEERAAILPAARGHGPRRGGRIGGAGAGHRHRYPARACTAAALRGLGIAWEIAGKPDLAEEAFQDSLTAAEGNPFFAAWASARLGACLARQGRPLEAAPHVRAALSADPPLTGYEARWAHAKLLAARGEDQACRAAATQALHKAEDGGYLILLPRLRELAGS